MSTVMEEGLVVISQSHGFTSKPAIGQWGNSFAHREPLLLRLSRVDEDSHGGLVAEDSGAIWIVPYRLNHTLDGCVLFSAYAHTDRDVLANVMYELMMRSLGESLFTMDDLNSRVQLVCGMAQYRVGTGGYIEPDLDPQIDICDEDKYSKS